MIQFQEYLSSDYPGFASFIDTIIKPIFGDGFRPDADLQEMIEYPDEIEEFDLISNSHDEDFRQLAQDCNVTRLLKLGIIRTSNGIPIHVYDITVGSRKHLARNRKGIQEIIRRNSEMTNQTGAFMLFHYADTTWEWRFSYCYVGRNREDTTSAKRYTYLLGRGQSCKTAALRFQTLLKKKGKIAMDDITEAFSVESVSKEFFDQYRLNYADIVCYVTGKRMVKAGGKWEEKQEHEPNEFIMNQFAQFADPEKAVRDYVKKLMGRLVFLQFIQKKGWLGVPMDDASWTQGDKEFIQHLFAQYEDKDNFIDDVLEPLFNDINTRRADDKANPVLGNDIKVPYLNGGLFEKDAEDDTTFPLPAKYMQDMLDFFSAYNFTIDENDPNDAEVGVDPEMLGRVFENLLEDNKDKGAFYTPKEIVQYMCRESLIAYLQTDIEDDVIKQSFRDFVTSHEVSTLKPADVYKVDKKLREVKICDPAIGSGAFPMGLLKELFDCRMAIEGEEEGKTPAEIKKDIIQNSIYGVDIEKGAVDIARLRFWLSLFIDEQTPHALPNMDFKIMQGNSLLEQYKGVRLDNIYSNSGQMELAFDEETAARMLFLEHIYKYFKEDDHDKKKELLVLIDNAVKSLVKAKTLGNEEIADSIDSLNLRNNTDFFLWHTWFNDVFENGGFDIVIGNPPYGVSIKGDYRKVIVDAIGQVPDYEIYYYFIQIASKLLKAKGMLSYIVPNTWLFNTFAKSFRIKLFDTWSLKEILDCSKFKIFESATVMNSIFVFEKNSKKNNIVGYRPTDRASSFDELISEAQNTMTKKQVLSMNQNWGLAFRLSASKLAVVQSLAKQPLTLSDFFDCSQGYIPYRLSDLVKTYGEEEGKRIKNERLWHSSQKSEEYWIQELYGRDITKYSYIPTGDYVKYGKHVATYVDVKYFNQKRVVVREITNPCIIATIVNHELLNDPQLLPLISNGKNPHFTYEVLWAILNSKLATFYHFNHSPKATKGAFPKILILDLNTFPIPKIKDCVLDVLNDKASLCLSEQSKGTNVSLFEQEIDQLVYKLYNLTPEEIAIVEGKNE